MKFKLATAAAAVLMSATASQAADLAKKAPVAVDYVKVCDAYGAGFFYIPGSETCLRIGGYVRAQVVGGSDDVNGDAYYGNYSDDRADDNFSTLGRLSLIADARSQTEYGVLRGFGQVNMSASSANKTTFEVDKAYIQFAGFTAGYAASFYDFFTGYSLQLKYGSAGELDETRNLVAYTFGFGNGLSATISVEDGKLNGRMDDGELYGTGNKAPDIVAQLKLAQAWGSAQVSAVAHHQYSYWSGANEVDEYGYAVLAGLEVNLPMLGAGDKIAIQATYGEGAIRYVSGSLGSSKAFSAVDFAGNGDSSSAWAVAGGFKHVFNPNWTLNLDLGYADLDQSGGYLDATQFDAAVSLAWTPVTNLNVNFAVEYRDTDVDGGVDGDGWVGGIRVNRTF